MIAKIALKIDSKIISDLPENTIEFNVSESDISYIENLPSSLIILRCSNSHLTSLPKLPDNLEYLNCNYNYITALPKLNKNLKELRCINNELTSLPELPDGLTRLYCVNNKLTFLPKMPDSLTDLLCYNNPLECIIPTKLIKKNISFSWGYEHYIPFITSYYGQDKMLSMDVSVMTELIEQLKMYDGKLHKDIKIKYADIINAHELNLL